MRLVRDISDEMKSGLKEINDRLDAIEDRLDAADKLQDAILNKVLVAFGEGKIVRTNDADKPQFKPVGSDPSRIVGLDPDRNPFNPPNNPVMRNG